MDGTGKLHKLLLRSLASLDTPLEQLVFLASIRDAYTGRYLHEGWARVADAQEAHRIAHWLHRGAFEKLLEMSLPDLAAGLRCHFGEVDGNEAALAALWLDTEPFREMLPAGSSPIEREFFVSQMRLALAVVAAEST